jgi:hypothetical protein
MIQFKSNNPDLRKLKEAFENSAKDMSRTVIFALSDTVDDVHDVQSKEFKSKLDLKTPYMKRSLMRSYPTGKGTILRKNRAPKGSIPFAPKRLRASIENAGTFHNPESGRAKGLSPDNIVSHHVFGGQRRMKPNEQALGVPFSQSLIVAKHNNPFKNAAGNIPAGRYRTIISQLAKREGRRGQFFTMYKGGQPFMIAKRPKGGQLQFALAYGDRATYKPRYRYYEVGRRIAVQKFAGHYNRIMTKTIKKRYQGVLRQQVRQAVGMGLVA